MSRSLVPCVMVVFALSACTESATQDGGTSVDTGAPRPDAGARSDSGLGAADALGGDVGSVRDGAESDALSDAGFEDAGLPDADPSDLDRGDAIALDAEAIDVGPGDAGAADAGLVDAFAPDAAPTDAGPTLTPPGGPCEPAAGVDTCAPPATCVAPDPKNPAAGRCFIACDFLSEPICPLGTGCNDRGGSSGAACVQSLPLGAICDDAPYQPTTDCAPPSICLRASQTATAARCTASRYTETVLSAPTFIDACALGAVVPGLTDLDDGHVTAPLSLPFSFQLYGTAYSELWPATNGYATLGVAPSDATFGLPSAGDGPAIAPFWTDLVMDASGARICYLTMGTRFVVEWEHAYRAHHSAVDLSFELVLDGSSHTIDFLYRTLTPTVGVDSIYATGLDSHIGVQEAAGASYSIHDGRVRTQEGLRFAP